MSLCIHLGLIAYRFLFVDLVSLKQQILLKIRCLEWEWNVVATTAAVKGEEAGWQLKRKGQRAIQSRFGKEIVKAADIPTISD